MRRHRKDLIACGLALTIFLSSCATYPTLEQVAMLRQHPGKPTNDLSEPYTITDLDVINYTNKIKEALSKHFNADSAIRYGSSATQVTLATLAGAAETAGWGVSTASGLGLASGYVFSLGQVFNAKDKAQTYEQAFTAVQAAEASYYFYRLGMGFRTESGRTIVLSGNPNGRADVPSSTNLTPDGETLYYRVSKVLKVLNDALANKIPDLQDLKDAKGESGGAMMSPAKPGGPAAAAGGGNSSNLGNGSSDSHNTHHAPPTPSPGAGNRDPQTRMIPRQELMARVAKLKDEQQIISLLVAGGGTPSDDPNASNKPALERLIESADAPTLTKVTQEAARVLNLPPPTATPRRATPVPKVTMSTQELLARIAQLTDEQKIISVLTAVGGTPNADPSASNKPELLRILASADEPTLTKAKKALARSLSL